MKPITIVGGGLSGLFLGIQLRRHGVPVQIKEAGHYPRHRVCGEFIHGQGLQLLRQHELVPILERAGARWARTTRFFSRDHADCVKILPSPALCLSRYDLDRVLASHFIENGGKLECGIRIPASTSDEEGMVIATGRSPRTHRSGWQWFGLKCHARGVALDADLEMFFMPNGYVGLCRLGQDKVNVCGLFRKKPGRQEHPIHPEETLRGPPGSILYERLANASFDDASSCSVAGLDMSAHRARQRSGCRIGDAITMIPPLTGNGMSMAFESATMAVESLLDYSMNRRAWSNTKTAIADRIDSAYKSRLRWASLFQNLLFTAWGQNVLLGICSRSHSVWRQAFQLTR
jgi:2-polyprenyl-6-methoxyphenol hydroxylase-like FAD-dependent oxidoreductase